MTNGEDSTFREQLAERIRRYAEQAGTVRKQLHDLEATLRDTEQRLEMAREMYRLEFSADPPGGDVALPPEEPPRMQRRRRGAEDSWNEAVLRVLRDEGKPLHVRDLWARLEARGFQTGAQDPKRALSTVLVRLPGVERTAPNTYGLQGQAGTTPQLALERDGAPFDTGADAPREEVA